MIQMISLVVVSVFLVVDSWPHIRKNTSDVTSIRGGSDIHTYSHHPESDGEALVEVESCPPWFIYDNTSGCVCGQSLVGIAECCSETKEVPCFPNTSVMTFPCACMTVDMETDISYAGYCPYTCFNHATWHFNPEVLNNRTCSSWNRAGRLCEECQEGYGLPIFSYALDCVECSLQDLTHNLLLIVLYFFSLTLFCFLVIVCRISAARPPFSTFVLISQVYAAPFQLQVLSVFPLVVSVNIYEIFFGVWNLNIFRPFYHSLCLTPRMSNLQAAVLQYSIGFYPLLLLALILALVRLRDSGCRGIVWICRPIHWCLARFRKNFNIRSSLTDAFSTFIILSYIKIGYTSIYILVPARVYQPDGSSHWYSYAEPSMRYLQSQHLPYALAAIAAAFVFCIVPFMILFLYPLKCFQKCLNCCGLRCLTLHAFADAFQGCYKDGTDGSRDYRWFAGVYLFFRFGMVLLFCSIKNYFIFALFASFVSFTSAAIVAVVQPYKKAVNVKIDVILLSGMGVLYFGLNLIAVATHVMPGIQVMKNIMLGVGTGIPMLYTLTLTMCYLFKHCSGCMKTLLQSLYRGRTTTPLLPRQ